MNYTVSEVLTGAFILACVLAAVLTVFSILYVLTNDVDTPRKREQRIERKLDILLDNFKLEIEISK